MNTRAEIVKMALGIVGEALASPRDDDSRPLLRVLQRNKRLLGEIYHYTMMVGQREQPEGALALLPETQELTVQSLPAGFDWRKSKTVVWRQGLHSESAEWRRLCAYALLECEGADSECETILAGDSGDRLGLSELVRQLVFGKIPHESRVRITEAIEPDSAAGRSIKSLLTAWISKGALKDVAGEVCETAPEISSHLQTLVPTVTLLLQFPRAPEHQAIYDRLARSVTHLGRVSLERLRSEKGLLSTVDGRP